MELTADLTPVEIIQTADLEERSKLPDLSNHQVYCGLDSCVTHEVHEVIAEQQDENTALIYGFSRALQAPVLEMMLRGMLTDEEEVYELTRVYEKRRRRVQYVVDHLANAIWDKELNPNSPKQLQELFYGHMGLPEIYKYEKGQKKLTCNRDALEKMQSYRYARAISIAVLASKSLSKKIGVLKSGIDDDGRMRFSYNIGGTNTGRFSSNKSVFGGGTNGQNITDELRRVFVADPGKKLAYLDLEQAESRLTAYIAGDGSYIAACESDDLHVAVARDIWPELNWSSGPNRNPASDRETSEQKFYRQFSYRDLAKRGGHLTNYVGQPASNAKNLHISVEVMKKFHTSYLKKFSGIRRYHGDTARILHVKKTITTPLGRKRLFFGRVYEDDILRKGVAYVPQSSVGDILNLGMWKVWKHLKEVQLLSQLHDAILFQYEDDPEIEARIIAAAKELMTIKVTITDTSLREPKTREMIIPVDATVGWNWAKYDPKKKFFKDGNPDGLLSYGKKPERKRLHHQEGNLLSRIM
ncbi:hypothetical protein LCGC14_1599950 [marine sediment metagenome]|uniref:DNA-directed DNA polymerase family A palm domain-containing protein n=1 Tax=marine sediment metagenome TaxID=412755 RepID=A0A0F9LBI1_9ZZZZ